MTNKPYLILTTAALALPGLQHATAQAADGDGVDFQYSHYEEGDRQGVSKLFVNTDTGKTMALPFANKRKPITVDSLHGSGRFSLTDRIKFAFNYTQDTWGGATPLGSAPAFSRAAAGTPRYGTDPDEAKSHLLGGASPFANSSVYLNKAGEVLYQFQDVKTGQNLYRKDRPVHVMGYASPETRKQGDFSLGYEWDEAGLDVGGGISDERDYESRFVNLGWHLDFNQKQTVVNAGLSYTNSAINAVLNHYVGTGGYIAFGPQHDALITVRNPETGVNTNTLSAKREDWAGRLGLTQVLGRGSVLNLNMDYTHSSGFLENPYKVSWLFGIDPNIQPYSADGIVLAKSGSAFIEQRPNERNLWHWGLSWTQYVQPLDAALHFNYQFGHDDWGINAHTFDADWVQPVGGGWTFTPRIRYYSQSAADFYRPYFVVPARQEFITDWNRRGVVLPKNFSSDQRLSGYGTLSGGLTVAKEFAKGIGVEAGFEYYTHQGGLKLGGGGEGSFADFDYWVANAALKLNFDAAGKRFLTDGADDHPHRHANVPAGVLFGHSLSKAGDMMLGYRFQHNLQAGKFLRGDKAVAEAQIVSKACPGSYRQDPADGSDHFDGTCAHLPREMAMSMHMLELMVAPTDWLTLMLMPQWMDMKMFNYIPDSVAGEHADHVGKMHDHETGGIGDTGLYALATLFDNSRHHLHAALGVSAPSGDSGLRVTLHANPRNQQQGFVHYGMQLGSGTWDFKPSLTYLGKAGDWNWGAQVAGTKRLESRNSSGYALGDLFEGSVWGGYDFTHWLSGTVRMAYSWQGAIQGRYLRSQHRDYQLADCTKIATYPDTIDDNGNPGPAVFHQADYNACLNTNEQFKRRYDAEDRPSPMDFPKNYGGQYVDLGLGISATVPSGAFAGNRLAFEWLQPIYTNVNGYQLDRDGALSFTWSYGF